MIDESPSIDKRQSNSASCKQKILAVETDSVSRFRKRLDEFVGHRCIYRY